MKSYEQLCSVARALDVVGDRWTLLIIRELLILRQARFTDLQNGLPRIPPNLLAQRLRGLQDDAVVHSVVLPPPATGSAYQLTERGRALEGVVRELLKWGAPTVPSAPAEASFQMHWLSLPMRYLVHDHRPEEPPATIRFGDLRDGFDLTVAAGTIHVDPCQPDAQPAATVNGPGPILVRLVQGLVSLPGALRDGVIVTGDPAALRRILPAARREPD